MTTTPEPPPADQPPAYGQVPPLPPLPPAPQFDYGQPLVQPGAPASPPPWGYGQQAYYPGAPQPAPRGLYTAAAIINWVCLGLIILGTCGIGIIAAAWFIPMTMNINKGSRDPWKHTTLAVCTLLFCNVVSGILMLVDDGNHQERPVAYPPR